MAEPREYTEIQEALKYSVASKIDDAINEALAEINCLEGEHLVLEVTGVKLSLDVLLKDKNVGLSSKIEVFDG